MSGDVRDLLLLAAGAAANLLTVVAVIRPAIMDIRKRLEAIRVRVGLNTTYGDLK